MEAKQRDSLREEYWRRVGQIFRNNGVQWINGGGSTATEIHACARMAPFRRSRRIMANVDVSASFYVATEVSRYGMRYTFAV